MAACGPASARAHRRARPGHFVHTVVPSRHAGVGGTRSVDIAGDVRMTNAAVSGIAVISCFLHLAAQPATAVTGGPKNANCAYPGKPSGGPCDVGHEQCCPGGPNTTCPMRTYTKRAAVFHLGNTQGCGENDPNGALSLLASRSIFARPSRHARRPDSLRLTPLHIRHGRAILRSDAWHVSSVLPGPP